MAGSTQGHTLIIRIHLDDPDNALRYGVNRVTVLEGKTPERDDPAAQIHFNCIECQSRYFISPKVIKMTELEIVSCASQTYHVKEEPGLDLLETRLETGNLMELIPADPFGNVKLEGNYIQNDSFDLPDPEPAIQLLQVDAQTEALMNRTKKRPKPKKKKSLEANEQPFYTCDICNASIKYIKSLKDHMKIHLGHRYACPKCPKVFVNKSNAKVHMKRAHNNEFRICKICNWSQNCTKDEYHSHLRRVHPETSFRDVFRVRVGDFNGVDFPCVYCEPQKAFSSYKELKDHFSDTHKRGYACKRCPKAFDSRHTLKTHTETIHEKKTFDCSTCGAQFKRKIVLLRHLENHPEKNSAAIT